MRFSDLRFLLAWALPLVSFYSITQAPGYAFVGTLAVWWGIALLDAGLPGGRRSPDPVDAEASLTFFRLVLRGYVLLQLALIGVGFDAAMKADWPTVLGIGFAVGFITGSQGITFAHELGHSKSRIDRFCGWVLMTSVCYGHFMVEHYRGHHPRAATHDDPASARYGESLYRFLPRTLWGSLASAWRLESQRLVQVLMLGILGLFGQFARMESAQSAMKLVVFFAFQSIVAFLLLEMVNYIEHYGLNRRSTDGKREPFGLMHAWNADHVVTNSLLVNLQRHSDHHMHAWKPYARSGWPALADRLCGLHPDCDVPAAVVCADAPPVECAGCELVWVFD
jgi:alkane 1-monooxygenase